MFRRRGRGQGPGLKGLLPLKHPGGVACGGLTEAEDEIQGGHEVQGKYVKLNENPQHQRDPEHAAQHDAGGLFPEKQRRCRQVGDAVYQKQGDSGKEEILKQNVRKGKHLKTGQHARHAHGAAGGIRQHARRAAHGAQPDKQRPENQRLPRRGKSRFHPASPFRDSRRQIRFMTQKSSSSG